MAYVRCIEYACLTIYYVFWAKQWATARRLAMHNREEYTMQNENSQGGNGQNMQ